MRKCWKLLAETLWPCGLKCLCCDERSEGKLLCPNCAKALSAMRLSAFDAGEDQVRSVYRYDGVARQLVLLLKEEGVADAASVLAEGMAETLRTMALPPDTVLTWVTMPELRRRKRWIDHGRRLCEEVALRSGLPAKKLLRRKGQLHTQRGLSRAARLRNLSGTILCNERVTTPVVVIDDVRTTGATIATCAEALMGAGAPSVYAVTATRAVVKRQKEDQKG